MDKKMITCKKCGRNDLMWWKSKKGNFYLTYSGGIGINGDNGRSIKTIYAAHECLTRAAGEELAYDRARFINLGLITTTAEEQAEAQAMEGQ
jgi:hypothetical protein